MGFKVGGILGDSVGCICGLTLVAKHCFCRGQQFYYGSPRAGPHDPGGENMIDENAPHPWIEALSITLKGETPKSCDVVNTSPTPIFD
jgi:hypothetical protein